MILTSNWNTPFLRATHRHGAIEFEKGRINNILALPTRVLSPPEMWHGEFGSSSGRKQITREIIDFFFSSSTPTMAGARKVGRQDESVKLLLVLHIVSAWLLFIFFFIIIPFFFPSIVWRQSRSSVRYYFSFRSGEPKWEWKDGYLGVIFDCLAYFFFLLLFTWSK